MSRCAHAISICVVFAISTLSPVPAFAQSASFRSVDTNSDGVLTFDELVAKFGRDGANRLLRSTDHNGDRRITISELRRGPDDDGRDSNEQRGDRTVRDNDHADDRDDDRNDSDDGGDDDGGDGGSDGGGDGDSDDDGDDGDDD